MIENRKESLTASKISDESAIPPPVMHSRRALYVGGLADEMTEVTLRAAMIPFGPLKSIDMPMDYVKGTHKGFAFVEFQDADDAAEAIYNMDGAEILGRALNVNLAQNNSVKLGSHKALWSTDEWFQQQQQKLEKEKGESVTIKKDETQMESKEN